MLDRLITDMGLTTPADVAKRAQDAEALVSTIVGLAEVLIEQHCQAVQEEPVW
jgi:hypothetical protein